MTVPKIIVKARKFKKMKKELRRLEFDLRQVVTETQRELTELRKELDLCRARLATIRDERDRAVAGLDALKLMEPLVNGR